MAAPLDPGEAEKGDGVANDVQIPVKPEQGDDESAEKKKGTNGFLVSLASSSVRVVADELGRSILQRVFTFGDTKLYVLECIAFVAAIASGVAVAMVNLVMGQFLTLLSDFSFSDANSIPGNFMSAVRTSA